MTNRFCDKCDLVKDDKIVLVKINDLPRYSLQSKYDIKKVVFVTFLFLLSLCERGTAAGAVHLLLRLVRCGDLQHARHVDAKLGTRQFFASR